MKEETGYIDQRNKNKKRIDDRTKQQAISVYESCYPSPKCALITALMIISPLIRRNDPDAEALLICGHIYKKLWLLDKSETEYLDTSINYYRRSFHSYDCLWGGFHYVNNLDLKIDYFFGEYEDPEYYSESQQEKRERWIKDVSTACAEIYNKVKELEESDDFLKRSDLKEIYATMANICFRDYSFSTKEDHEKYERLFFDQNPSKHEIKKYLERKNFHILLYFKKK